MTIILLKRNSFPFILSTIMIFEQFDYIVGMDNSNVQDISEITGMPKHPKIIRLLDLTEHRKDVPDPYYTGDFEETYNLVSEGCWTLLKKIRDEHNLT